MIYTKIGVEYIMVQRENYLTRLKAFKDNKLIKVITGVRQRNRYVRSICVFPDGKRKAFTILEEI